MLKTFKFADVIAVTEWCSKPIVNTWLAKGVMVPSIERSAGRGRGNRFSASDLVIARVLARLQAFGFSWAVLQRAAMTIMRIEIDLPELSPKLYETWNCITDPAKRRPDDFALLLLSNNVPNGFEVTLGSGAVAAIDARRLGAVWIAVDLRQAIEDVERMTGVTWSGRQLDEAA